MANPETPPTPAKAAKAAKAEKKTYDEAWRGFCDDGLTIRQATVQTDMLVESGEVTAKPVPKPSK